MAILGFLEGREIDLLRFLRSAFLFRSTRRFGCGLLLDFFSAGRLLSFAHPACGVFGVRSFLRAGFFFRSALGFHFGP